MAKFSERNRAIEMRKRGMSYSQIKDQLNVSKGTLSLWLRDMPLSERRIRELRDYSEQRIEKTRETKRKKKLTRMYDVYKKAVDNFGTISRRELYIAGFFLYWGEGLKADPYTIMFTNTDPAMVRCFIAWIQLLDIEKSKLKVYLHLYSDMNTVSAISFWSKELDISKTAFRKPYIKKITASKRKHYKGRFGFGTCNVYVSNRDVRESVAAGIARLREIYGGVAFERGKAL